MLSRRHALQLLTCAPASLLAQTTTPSLAVSHVTVIDGAGGVLRDQNLLVAGDRIATLGNAARVAIPRGAQVIDGRGRFLIPGLWDMHAHVSYTKASALPVLLANGVTGIRDMGGLLDEIDRWRADVESGVRPGPRIVRAGPIVNGKVFNEFQIAVTDAAEARGAVRALHRSGVDFIKVHAAISHDAWLGVCNECKALGLPFAGHIPRAVTPEEVSDSGQVTLEHAGAIADRMSRAGVPAGEVAAALERFRREEAPALFARFARNGTYFTPTLITSQAAIHLGDRQPDPRDRYVSASCKKITAELMTRPEYRELVQPESVARQKREFRELLPLVGELHKAGVELLAGTDFAASILYPGFSLHDELALLVEAGLTPMQSLQTATRNPARMLHRDDLGIIQPGKLADLVLLDADPLADIRNTQRIRAVVCRGKYFDRRALDQLLAQAESEASRT